jgi:hypothetical protein
MDPQPAPLSVQVTAIIPIIPAILPVDEPTWARSRGWVLSQALIALSTYTLQTNRILVLEAQRWMTEVLRDDISTPERTPERR